MEGAGSVDVTVFRGELNAQFVPRERGVHVGSVAVVVVGRKDQSSRRQREGPHFLVRFVHVPVFGQVRLGEVEVQLNGRVATASSGELEGVVIEAVNADLAASVLGLVPKVGHHDAGPFARAEAGFNGAHHFNLPRPVVEGLRDTIVTPSPFAFGLVVKNGVELVEFQVRARIREPRHGDDVAVGGLDNAALTQPFLSGVGGHEGPALGVG